MRKLIAILNLPFHKPGFMFVALFLLLVPLSGQDSTPTEQYLQEKRSVSTFNPEEWEAWEEKKTGLHYLEDIEKAKEKTKKEGKDKEENNPFLEKAFLKGLSTFLLIIIGIVIAFFLIRQLLGMKARPRNRKINRQGSIHIDLDQIEENLEEVTLTDYIQDAIQASNFALATRLYYLDTLKSLSKGKQIKWKKDKTNRDYLNEMQSSPLFDKFQYITHVFENIWYGNRSINGPSFREIQPFFQSLISEVEASNTPQE